ncbi:replication-associated recombination protein A [Pararhizobium sp. BT-229]|uniref:replication-associated recombination protein A n=1 Tax=Pararhizobium sp. BT-229 TaxID=2986923 RepID=UPI0021F6C885|nr:replication-associated recombination protein A [Pararhizobium sp. BT-229]MCV9964687.1 replication-associated recombination protein A [Pararhizobium sp. BT-229]
MDNLFSAARADGPKPLADAARPSSIDDIIGQSHLLGEGKTLRRRISEGRLGSIVLYGPPGVGKTTIARAVGNTLKKRFEPQHAAGFKVDVIKKIVDEAQVRDTLVFIDEIHRLSATQQDYLLDHAEKGTFDLITATSVNPYHNLSDALCSRSAVYELRPLTESELLAVIDRGVARLKAMGREVEFEPFAKVVMARKSGGDARRALTTLESVVLGRGNKVFVTEEMVDEELAAAPFRYDRKGDMHYDAISAFVKSMRGGDADATLYWLAFLINAGEDPRYIARRMVVHASEDVGLADNSALQTAVACFTAVERVGMPEGRIVLAHAALHICRAPKSNSAFRGINMAEQYIKANGVMPVPNHLRDTHYVGAAPLGRGGYKSPHSAPEGWLEQEYAPGIGLGQFYQSDARHGQTFEARSDSYWEVVMKKLMPRKWGRKD